MRAINLRPSGSLRLVLALLPFLALLLAYVIGSHIRLAENPNDKLLPSFADMGETIYAYAFEADPRTGQYLLWSDTAASLTRLLIGLAISAVFALVVGILIGLLPIMRRDVRAVRRRAVHGAAARAAADPVHRHGARRSLEDHADRHRHDLEAHPRHRARASATFPREQLIKAQTLGASTAQIASRIVLPQILPRLIDCRSPGDRPGLAVPHRGRGDRRRLRPRLPHLPRAPLSVDGRDPALRRLDHAARLPHGPRPAAPAAQGLPLVRAGEGGMSAIVFDKVWKEYGDHIVLEQIDLDDRAARLPGRWSAPPAAARRRSCACCSARSSRRAAPSCWTASR